MLYQHPAVHQAAVFGLPSRVMGELVGAAVTLRPEAQASKLWAAMLLGMAGRPNVASACANRNYTAVSIALERPCRVCAPTCQPLLLACRP